MSNSHEILVAFLCEADVGPVQIADGAAILGEGEQLGVDDVGQRKQDGGHPDAQDYGQHNTTRQTWPQRVDDGDVPGERRRVFIKGTAGSL